MAQRGHMALTRGTYWTLKTGRKQFHQKAGDVAYEDSSSVIVAGFLQSKIERTYCSTNGDLDSYIKDLRSEEL